jgi:hypothetical protein
MDTDTDMTDVDHPSGSNTLIDQQNVSSIFRSTALALKFVYACVRRQNNFHYVYFYILVPYYEDTKR